MKFVYRKGSESDLPAIKALGIKVWTRFKQQLTASNWQQLEQSITADKSYQQLVQQANIFLCELENGTLIGMAFLVPSGNPTDIYSSDWSYIRFVSVDPAYEGKGIGRTLTKQCIAQAKQQAEKTIALHTSEMMGNARHLYESLGFTILREIEPRFGKRYWLYSLTLDAIDL